MPELTERDAELLFAYLDGELAAAEVTALEQRLNEDDFLRRELASLRQMLGLIHALPEAKAPRNFTLTPQMVAPKPAPALHVLAAAEPMAAANTAAAPAPLMLNKPAPRRATWQALAAAAAVFVLAVGFIGIALNNSQSATVNVALAPTEAAFSNMPIAQNTATPELSQTPIANDAEAANATPVVAGETDIIEETARKDPTETALLEQPRTTEIQPEEASALMMSAPSDTGSGAAGMGGAPKIDNQVPGFSINPDPNMSGFTVATLPPDALYYVQMTATPLPPQIDPNDANPLPPITAQMTFAPDTSAASAQPPATSSQTSAMAGAGSAPNASLNALTSLIFTPNVRDGFLLVNGLVLLHWLFQRLVLEQP